MNLDSDLPKLPVIQKGTIDSTFCPVLDSGSMHEMDSYFVDIMGRIQMENPQLYQMLESRITTVCSDAEESGLDEDISLKIINEIFVVTGIIYGLLERQLRSDYLSSAFQVTD